MLIYVYVVDCLLLVMRIVVVFFVLVGVVVLVVLIMNVYVFEGMLVGFKILNGKIIDVDLWVVFFNLSFFIIVGYVVLFVFMMGVFIVVFVVVYKMIWLRKKEKVYCFYWKVFLFVLMIGGIFLLLIVLNGYEFV